MSSSAKASYLVLLDISCHLLPRLAQLLAQLSQGVLLLQSGPHIFTEVEVGRLGSLRSIRILLLLQPLGLGSLDCLQIGLDSGSLGLVRLGQDC